MVAAVSEAPVYKNAQHAFEHLYHIISCYGEKSRDTLSVYNTGFYIDNPMDNHINTAWRNWSLDYAKLEWQWYLSGNPNPDMVASKAKLWNTLRDNNGHVNSNYGHQWQRGDQLSKVIAMLNDDRSTRRAVVSLYDGKEIDKYSKDTICTLAINFFVTDNKLYMNVFMRSNDLIYGFCNDQYQFSNLLSLVSKQTNIEIGKYYHFVTNMHIYKKHWDMDKKQKQL